MKNENSTNKLTYSWGNTPKETQRLRSIYNQQEELTHLKNFKSFLPYGLGRSYGDSCLNGEDVLLETSHLNRFLHFDHDKSLLTCEAGVSLDEILKFFIPKGFFLPVTPGTRYITIGGAIANDVHGKNHHKEGTFGCHVTQFMLLRSNGERRLCSPCQNNDLFRATIGGLGLTGLILWAQFKMIKIETPLLLVENIKYHTLDEFFDIDKESSSKFDYTVAWIDLVKGGPHMGRGIYMRGNFVSLEEINQILNSKLKAKAQLIVKEKKKINIPCFLPNFSLNPITVKAFNTFYFNKSLTKSKKFYSHYEPFFYPLDAVDNWNRIYGKNGFYQYQFVIPFNKGREGIKEIVKIIGQSKMASFLAVLKNFGEISSPGTLSFPRPGITLAMDFKNEGEKTDKFFNRLDHIVKENGGIVYPAKDARMNSSDFQNFYPQWKEFSKFIDPKFSSTFWRRVIA